MASGGASAWLCLISVFGLWMSTAATNSIDQCNAPEATAAINPSDTSRNITVRWRAAPENDGSNTPRKYPTLMCSKTNIRCSDYSATGPMYLREITLTNAFNFSGVSINVSVQSPLLSYSMSGFVVGQGSIAKVPTGGEAQVSTIESSDVDFLSYLFTPNAMPSPYDATVNVVFACMGAQVIQDPCRTQDAALIGAITHTEVVEQQSTDPDTNITSTTIFNVSAGPPPILFPLTTAVTSSGGRSVLRLRLNNTFRKIHRNMSTNSSGSTDNDDNSSNTTLEHVVVAKIPYDVDNTTSQFTFTGFFGGSAGNYSVGCVNASVCTVVVNASFVAAGGAFAIDFTVERPGCPVSSYEARQYTLEATSTPEPVVPPTATIATLNNIGKTTAALIGVTAGVAILSGSTTAGSKSASVATVRRLLVCQSSDEPTNSVLGFGFGSPERYYMRGAVVGNTAVVVMVMTVVLTTALIIAFFNRDALPVATTFTIVTELLHVPSILFPASAAMIQPTAGAAITLVVIGDANDIALGVLWLILGSAFMAYAARITVLGPFHGTLIVGGAAPIRKPNFVNSDGKAWELAQVWFSGRFKWSPEKAHKPWKRRHMFLFFESKYKWYPFAMEIFIPGFLGVVAGLVVDDDSVCMSQMVVLLVTNVVQLGIGVLFRPSLTMFDEMFLHVINSTSLLIIVLLIVGYLKDDDGGLTEATEKLLLLFTIMTMLKVFVDFVTLCMAFKTIVARIRELFRRKVELIVHGKSPDDVSDVDDSVPGGGDDDHEMMEEVLYVKKKPSPAGSILGSEGQNLSPRSPIGSAAGGDGFPTPPLQEKDIAEPNEGGDATQGAAVDDDGDGSAVFTLSPRASVSADIDDELQYSTIGAPASRPFRHRRDGQPVDLLETRVDHDSILFSHPSRTESIVSAPRHSSLYEALW
jgi:hypothetical protein